MSHLIERKEKNCLNCNAVVSGRYCSVCGQENIEPNETVWHLVTHFFNDITHFDGKFFSTVSLMLTKPGFLTSEYKIGRRASYLNPVRMYIFTSAVFFLIFFSIYDFSKVGVKTKFNGLTEDAVNKMDSASLAVFTYQLTDSARTMTREEFKKYADSLNGPNAVIIGRNYRDRAQYDSLLRTGSVKHGWLQKKLIYKQIEVNQKYKNDQGQLVANLINILMHSFPQMLFVSLPLFAIFLKLLYWRHKDILYVNHAIFSVHLYIFTFVVLLLVMLIQQLAKGYESSWLNWVYILFTTWIFFYEYKAMRNFYGQRRGKTILKFFLLNTWLFVVILLLFVVFLFFSFFKV